MKKLNKLWITVYTKAGSYDDPYSHTIETRVLIENGSIYGADNLRSHFLDHEDFFAFLKAATTKEEGVWSGVRWEHDKVVDAK